MLRPLSLLMSILPAALATGGEHVEFNRDIRPILTKHCTACHGGVKEAGGISFIYREKALGRGKSGERPIVPGKPAESDMLRRLRSSDPDEVMPQPKHGPPLAAAEIALIERWISQGAEWQNHWAFVPPKETPLAEISDEKWPTSPLDRFILQRLDRENLKPSPEASPAEWLRRVSFDLTGLPPAAEDLARLENDRAAVVDRLLAPPHFGERWAAVWLDLARYSDTYGFEKDPHRDVWPFRDWVIRAFNSDMPYDRFTIEQLAGDLLPNATADQRLATAFHRNTQTNTEGGTDDEEFRVAAVIDRVSTTWTTWQATTCGCVQCHSHPYDPIAHDEFYKFTAFFNSTADFDQDDDFPRMKVPTDPAKSAEASALEIEMRILREQLNRAGHDLAETADDWKPFTPDIFAPSHGKLAVSDDGTIRSEGTLPKGNVHKVSGPAPAFSALRLRVLPEKDDPKNWPERGSLVTKFEVNLIDPTGAATPLAMKEVFADHLGAPNQPEPGGNFGAFPKLEGPRWFVFVPGKSLSPAPGARLEISMTQKGETVGSQATPVRRFAVDVSNSPEWTMLVEDPQRAASWKSHDEMARQYKAIEGKMVPVMLERPLRRAPGAARVRRFARHPANRFARDDRRARLAPRVLRRGLSEQLGGIRQTRGNTGSQNLGAPSIGAWATYGLGSENQNLPGFIVLTSGAPPDAGKSVWGAGYLPSVYQGVQCRSQGELVLYLDDPAGISRGLRRRSLDTLDRLNPRIAEDTGDPETVTRIAQYEMAYRMQTHATDASDLKQESPATHQIYEAMTDKVSVHDLHATMMQLMGFDHERLTFPSQGAPQRLTNITKPGSQVVKGILA